MDFNEIKLAVTFETEGADIDMYYGLNSLLGACNTTSKVGDAILTKAVRKRKTQKSTVRNRLKLSAKGSFIQHFSLQIREQDAANALQRMNKTVFSEVMSHFIHEGLYLEALNLSREAKEVIKELEPVEEELKEAIKEPLKQLHEIPRVYKSKVKLEYAKPGGWLTIAKFDDSTAKNLTEVTELNQENDYVIRVTRFNTYTLNGRLVIEGEEDTLAFGFAEHARKVELEESQLISENLHINNNGGTDDKYVYLSISAKKLILPTGTTVKLLITKVKKI